MINAPAAARSAQFQVRPRDESSAATSVRCPAPSSARRAREASSATTADRLASFGCAVRDGPSGLKTPRLQTLRTTLSGVSERASLVARCCTTAAETAPLLRPNGSARLGSDRIVRLTVSICYCNSFGTLSKESGVSRRQKIETSGNTVTRVQNISPLELLTLSRSVSLFFASCFCSLLHANNGGGENRNERIARTNRIVHTQRIATKRTAGQKSLVCGHLQRPASAR